MNNAQDIKAEQPVEKDVITPEGWLAIANYLMAQPDANRFVQESSVFQKHEGLGQISG